MVAVDSNGVDNDGGGSDDSAVFSICGATAVVIHTHRIYTHGHPIVFSIYVYMTAVVC